MKKLFPLIISLTAISLLGIIVVQVQWITSAIQLKQDQYKTNVTEALYGIKDSIVQRKVIGTREIDDNPNLSNSPPAKTVFSYYEMGHLIQTQLNETGVKQEFEYCITDDAVAITMNSDGFREEFFGDPEIYNINISGKTSANSETLHLYILKPQDYFKNQLLFMVLGALLFTCIIIAAFVLTIRTMLSQRKLSEIKSDFINNMTHEFKTPIATIQLASDALNNEKVLSDKKNILYYRNIIKEENRRMHKQVERILNAAKLEKDEIKLQLKEVDVHDIIKKVVNNSQLQVEEANAELNEKLGAHNHIIMADEVHFSNIIFNLLDNAIKYTEGNPSILISTENFGNSLHIRLKDNGIGMPKEVVNNIFEKFYRAHTGNKHNVKGFGLGLTYVKRVIDLHEAKISVESVPGEGSEFTIVFPFIDE
jgi:two-component system phosphate regulon sensor histidine kinase PhoR